MRSEDSNHDGKLSMLDAQWKDLKVWVDANGDGKTDSGELVSLDKLGIIEIDLTAHSSSEINNGNVVGLVSSYKTTDGKSHEVADVWFTRDNGHNSAGTAAASGSTSHDENGANAQTATHTTTVAAAAGQTNQHETAASSTDQPVGSTSEHPNLGVSTSDLLADPGHNLLPGGDAGTNSGEVMLTTAVVHTDVTLLPIDHTQLMEEQKNTPLI